MRLEGGRAVRLAFVAIFVTVLLLDMFTLIRSASANVLWGYWQIGRRVSPPTETATPTATPTPAGKLVFVTSSGFFGNLGGTAGGNTDCNNAASAAGLPGTYKAWLSTAAAGDNPASSFTQSTIPYVLVDNTQVAANWTALVSGTLDHAIDEDEHGTITTQSSVWTGTNANGTAPTYPQQVLDCFGWSDQTDLAYVGSPTATNSTWSIQEGIMCNNLEPLYCFQQ
jgi:hypothetical protein